MTAEVDRLMSREDRFDRFVDRRGSNDCWPWKGGKINRDGRGTFWMGKDIGQITAPRAAWWRHTGGLPPRDFFVCHSCDNPSCVNPAHLFLGKSSDNMKDASDKGRLPGQKLTHCPRGHAYTPDNIRRIGYRARNCLKCGRIYKRAARARLKARAIDAAIKEKP